MCRRTDRLVDQCCDSDFQESPLRGLGLLASAEARECSLQLAMLLTLDRKSAPSPTPQRCVRRSVAPVTPVLACQQRSRIPSLHGARLQRSFPVWSPGPPDEFANSHRPQTASSALCSFSFHFLYVQTMRRHALTIVRSCASSISCSLPRLLPTHPNSIPGDADSTLCR